MLRWQGNLLWSGVHILADVVLFGPGDVHIDLHSWQGFGLCDYSYSTVQQAKSAAESWARNRHLAVAPSSLGPEDLGDDGVTDDDIPF